MPNICCAVCNKNVYIRPYLIKLGYGKFCSAKCYGIWQSKNRVGRNNPSFKEKIRVTCNYCKSEIELFPYRAKQKLHFCNRKCLYSYRKEHGWCGGEDNGCWLGGNTQYRGKNWQAQKNKVIERDGYKCQNCNNTTSLTVHHIIPFHLFDDYKKANEIDNLITLCKWCHGIEEVKFNKNNPYIINKRKIPYFKPETKTCRKCGNMFMPATHRVILCDDCITFKCKNCGGSFKSRRYDRKICFCSSKCRKEYFSTKCKRCGKDISWGSAFCIECFNKYIKPSSGNFLVTKKVYINKDKPLFIV